MPPIISFVGWHDSGKTTLCRQVVLHLKEKGYLVAVIKSTKETGIVIDQPGTDTALYKQSGVDAIALMAPDQLIIQRKPIQAELIDFAQTLFPDMDIIVAEGFKGARNVAKIEVRRDPQAPWIHQQVSGVEALASDHPHGNLRHFTLDQGQAIADYIEAKFLLSSKKRG
nr:molybdopterin-guanine dinucleotide biosynthesis protein B [uncultured Desulfobulbus sp.]